MSTVTRARACEGKRKLTREGAQRMVASLIESGTAEGAIAAYECPFGSGHWHVGHILRRGRRRS